MTAKESWNKKYSTSNYFLYGKEPSFLLTTHFDLLKKHKVIDIGMGEGRNSVYLASKGFEVEGIDCSDVAISRAQQLATDTGVQIKTTVSDLDFFIMPLMKYDTVLLSFYKPQMRLFEEIRRGLVQGGTVFIENYTTDQLNPKVIANPTPQTPEFEECFKPNEILRHLNLHQFKILYFSDRRIDDKALIQCIAKKL